jgi:hypothetical protein
VNAKIGSWYEPTDWVEYSPQQLPVRFKLSGTTEYTFFKLTEMVRNRFFFEIYDFSKHADPQKEFSVETMDGLREVSENKLSLAISKIAKITLRDSLGH